MPEEKKIADYLHLYVPCQYWRPWDNKTGFVTHYNIATLLGSKIGNIKPIFRSLSDMTDQECMEWAMIRGYKEFPNFKRHINGGFEFGGDGWGTFLTVHPPYGNRHQPEQFCYLLKKGFDLFNLIESGLAINRSTL